MRLVSMSASDVAAITPRVGRQALDLSEEVAAIRAMKVGDISGISDLEGLKRATVKGRINRAAGLAGSQIEWLRTTKETIAFKVTEQAATTTKK